MSVEEAYALKEAWLRHEAVMEAIKNPATQEGGIARRAVERLNQMAAELQLDGPVAELAHQVRGNLTSTVDVHTNSGGTLVF